MIDKFKLIKLDISILDDCVDLFIETFSKEPWIKVMEYYIDELCIKFELQGKGIGSKFIELIEEDIKLQCMNGIILNTERNYPSQTFYEKNGFEVIEDLIILAK